jgi:hypothetical protein
MFDLWRKVIASLLVAQLMTGYCCAHHAGLCDASVPSSPAPEAAISGSPDSGCLGGSPLHKHNGHQGCQVGPCSTVLLSRVISLPIQLSQALAVSLHGDMPTPIGTASDQHFSQFGELLLPVRLHLANQVLLI